MSIRTIEYKIDAKGISPVDVQNAGLQGEDRATDLVFCLSQAFYDDIIADFGANVPVFRVDTQDGAGGFHAGEQLQIDPAALRVVYSIPRAVTTAGGVSRSFLVISAVDERNQTERVVYSFPALLYFASTPQGSTAQVMYQKELSGLAAEVAADRALAARYAEDAQYAAAQAAEAKRGTDEALAQMESQNLPELVAQTQKYANSADKSRQSANEDAKQAYKYADAAQTAFQNAADFAGEAAGAAREAKESANQLKNLYPLFSNALKGEKSGTTVRIENAEQNPLDTSIHVQVSSKNLIPYPYIQGTVSLNGITLTDKGDGTIGVSGTPTGGISYSIIAEAQKFTLPKGTYFYSLYPSEYKNTWGYAYIFNITDNVYIQDTGKGVCFTLDKPCEIRSAVIINSNYDGTPFTLCPQLEFGTTATAFTPFVADLTNEEIAVYNDMATDEYYFYNPDENGLVGEITVCSSETNIQSLSGRVTVTATYNKDVNYAFAELQQAIISLGGNV